MSLVLQSLGSRDALHAWVRLYCGIDVPRRAVCAGHVAPFDYLALSYFEPSRDQVIHAPRGGGKTRLAALATLLDLLHKPGISVRILGGSLEQSMKMWEHLVPDLRRLIPDEVARLGEASRVVRLPQGGSCSVLTQSQRAVRGLRVQKLRCDEVELFDPAVWEAAQLTTRSVQLVGTPEHERDRRRTKGTTHRFGHVRGAIEALSTLHESGGLMQRIVDDAEARGTVVQRWCLLDVLARCEAERACETCPLWDDCSGVAKTACDGFVSIDDAIAMKKRVSRATWEAEMLCRRPSVRGRVFPMFERAKHVREHVEMSAKNVPAIGSRSGGMIELSCGIDFGFAAPLVCLWMRSDGERVWVIDEYVQPMRPFEEHLEVIVSRGHGMPAWVGCDPAGRARNDQTGVSSVQLMRQRGLLVRSRASRIMDGVEMIRQMLEPASGEVRLFVHPRCVQLIRAMEGYRLAELPAGFSELPMKDGEHDHAIDALRYMLVNRASRGEASRDGY